jgi:peptide/nickel transport system permease protein
MKLRRYLARRLLQMVPAVFMVVVLNFILIHSTPGDPASALSGEHASLEHIEEVRRSYGLDKPILQQLGIYLAKLVQGDLGFSYAMRRPVAGIILERLPATLLLILMSQIVAIFGGTALGTYAARHYGGSTDRVLSMAGLGFYAVPVFWSGMMLILLFGVHLRWLPTSGMVSFTAPQGGIGRTLDIARHLVLPSLALALYTMPTYLRLTRASILEVMREDYVTTARAAGFSENTIFFRYALRNALLPTVTMAGFSLGLLFAGALLTETVFGWPGTGRLMIESVIRRDYPILMGVFLITSVSVVVASLVTDLIYAVLDPRVTYD